MLDVWQQRSVEIDEELRRRIRAEYREMPAGRIGKSTVTTARLSSASAGRGSD
jgi:hypothetical protein